MKRIISLILIAIIICLSISPVFADEETDPISYNVNESVMAYYIWLMLSSWGISINTGTPGEYNSTIEDKIIDWVMEYLDTLPSAYTISTWIAPWQASLDYWGNFRGNASMLEDINDFGEWLVDYLTLSDDSTIVVDPVTQIDGIQLYAFNTYYVTDVVNGQLEIIYMQLVEQFANETVNPIGWFVAHDPYAANQELSWYAITVTLDGRRGSVAIAPLYYNAAGTTIEVDGGYVSRSGPTENGLYWYGTYQSKILRAIPQDGTYYEGAYQDFLTWINNAEVETVGDILIITSTLDLPVDDPDYSSGDSIIIVGDEPTYTIDFPDNMEVSNLPAIISEGAVPDPQFADVFSPVSALITAMVPAITIVQGIAFELPDIMITFFLAMCGCLIFFGFVRKLME